MLSVSRPLIRNVCGEWATAPLSPERSDDRPKSSSSMSSVMRRKALARRFRAFQGDPIIVPLDSAVADAGCSGQGVPALQHHRWMNSDREQHVMAYYILFSGAWGKFLRSAFIRAPLCGSSDHNPPHRG